MNFMDSFGAMKTIVSPKAYTPISGELPGYNLLCIFEADDPSEREIVESLFSLFSGCHLTSDNKHDAEAATVVTSIYDAEGTVDKYDKDRLFGVFVRGNLPMWIYEIIFSMKTIAQLILNVQLGNGVRNHAMAILTADDLEDHMKHFLQHPDDHKNDLIFAAGDPKMLKQFTQLYSETWTISDDTPVTFCITGFDGENIIVSPVNELTRLLPYSYRTTVSQFKELVLSKKIGLWTIILEDDN
jgi:hypothetical protein